MADRIELLRRGYDAWNSGDLDGLLALCHPGITIRPLIGAVVAAGEYHGHEGARRVFDDARRPWQEFHIDPEEFLEVDDSIVVGVYVRIRTKNDPYTIDGHVAHAVKFTEGLVASLEAFPNRDDALASVNP